MHPHPAQQMSSQGQPPAPSAASNPSQQQQQQQPQPPPPNSSNQQQVAQGQTQSQQQQTQQQPTQSQQQTPQQQQQPNQVAVPSQPGGPPPGPPPPQAQPPPPPPHPSQMAPHPNPYMQYPQHHYYPHHPQQMQHPGPPMPHGPPPQHPHGPPHPQQHMMQPHSAQQMPQGPSHQPPPPSYYQPVQHTGPHPGQQHGPPHQMGPPHPYMQYPQHHYYPHHPQQMQPPPPHPHAPHPGQQMAQGPPPPHHQSAYYQPVQHAGPPPPQQQHGPHPMAQNPYMHPYAQHHYYPHHPQQMQHGPHGPPPPHHPHHPQHIMQPHPSQQMVPHGPPQPHHPQYYQPSQPPPPPPQHGPPPPPPPPPQAAHPVPPGPVTGPPAAPPVQGPPPPQPHTPQHNSGPPLPQQHLPPPASPHHPPSRTHTPQQPPPSSQTPTRVMPPATMTPASLPMGPKIEKKEITFPKNSVEATKPLMTKRRKFTSKDVTDIEVWRLLMCLKSGLLAESSWAIDVLSILLNDETTSSFFTLANMPGLLEAVLEHFKCCLNENFKDMSIRDTTLKPELSKPVSFTHWLEGNGEDTSHIQVYFDPENFIESSRRCICISTILRNLSFIQGNDVEMSRHPGLLLILGKILMYKPDDATYNEIDSPPNEWHLLNSLREDTLVIVSNISSSLDLSPYNDKINLNLLKGLLHWACCTSTFALDPFPPPSMVSPQRLALESLAKLSIIEGNVDLILATPPWVRLGKLFEVLTNMLSMNEDQTVREFSLVLLSNLTAADSVIARRVALTSGAIPRLVSFIERSITDRNENIMTTLDMLRRAAVTLKYLSQLVDNHPLFAQHQPRLLNLVMSGRLDQEVAPIIADVIFEISLSNY